jgi:hypothetical protein
MLKLQSFFLIDFFKGLFNLIEFEIYGCWDMHNLP